MPASIKIATINAGRGFSGLYRIESFLKGEGSGCDVICVQDVQKRHTEMFGHIGYFVPMTKHYIEGEWQEVGIGIFSSNHSFTSTSAHAYVGAVQPVKDIRGVRYDARGNASPVDLELVRETESRIVVFVEFTKGGHRFNIATTHGVWSPGGKVDDHQRRSMKKLELILRSCRSDFVLAGDLNAARGGEIYQALMIRNNDNHRHLFDYVPPEIENTVDWFVRGKAGPNLLVDHLITNSPNVYEATDVKAHFSVSDHAALTATITKCK